MASMRQRQVRGLGAVVFALLLLVPVVASAHRHVGHATAPCAACAVTHHTPLVSAPAVVMPTAAPVVVRIEPPSASLPAEPAVRAATERGPPSSLRALGS
jgi:hypothetical protein